LEDLDTVVIIQSMLFFAPIFWGISIGKRLGLKYWLFDSFEGFGASFLVPFGGFILFLEAEMYFDGEETAWFIILFGAFMFLSGASKLYTSTAEQTYTTSDAIGLFLGKLFFGVITLGLIFIIAFMVGKKNKS